MTSANAVNHPQAEIPTIEMIERNTINKIERANFLIGRLSKMAMNHDKTIQLTKNRISIIEKKLDLNEHLFKKISSYKEKINNLNMAVSKIEESVKNKKGQLERFHQVSYDKLNEINTNIQLIEVAKDKIEQKIVHFSKKIGENRDDIFLERAYLKNSIEKINLNLDKRIKRTSKYKDELESIFTNVDYTVNFINDLKIKSELPIGDKNKITMFDKDKEIILNLNKLDKSLKVNVNELYNKGVKIQRDTHFIDGKNKDVIIKIAYLNNGINDFNKNIAGNVFSPNINLISASALALVNIMGVIDSMNEHSQCSISNHTRYNLKLTSNIIIKH